MTAGVQKSSRSESGFSYLAMPCLDAAGHWRDARIDDLKMIERLQKFNNLISFLIRN
jgi:hypothetical protein